MELKEKRVNLFCEMLIQELKKKHVYSDIGFNQLDNFYENFRNSYVDEYIKSTIRSIDFGRALIGEKYIKSATYIMSASESTLDILKHSMVETLTYNKFLDYTIDYVKQLIIDLTKDVSSSSFFHTTSNKIDIMRIQEHRAKCEFLNILEKATQWS